MIPREIILHHSLTADSGTVSWGAIRRYHTDAMGWRDIGYHFGVELVGEDYEVLLGRTPLEDGAHTVGHNQTGIGICFVGNFDDDPVPAAQWLAGIKLVRWLMAAYGIPAKAIHGHREFAPYKTCPGILFDVDRFILDVLTLDTKGGPA